MKFLIAAFVFTFAFNASAAEVIKGDEAKKVFDKIENSGGVLLAKQYNWVQLRKANVACKKEVPEGSKTTNYSCETYDIDPELTPEKLCSTFTAEGKKNKGESLKALRIALGAKGGLGANAKGADLKIKEQGFSSIAVDSTRLTKNLIGTMPNGTIFILEKKPNTNCPVNKTHGDIAIKCANDTVVLSAGRSQKTADFISGNVECIKTSLMNELWISDLNMLEKEKAEAASAKAK